MAAETRTTSAERTAERGGRNELLIVGPFREGRVGGIHRYIDEQRRRFDGEFAVAVYNVAGEPVGNGLTWFITGFLRSLVAAMEFPFRSPPDIVHLHTSHGYSFYRTSVYALFAAYVWRRPVVLHVHGSSFDEFVDTKFWPVRRLQSAVFDAVDRVVVLSEYWRDALEDRVDGDKLRVVPNAVVPTEYEPSYDADPPHLVFVSSLIPRKGVYELVTAIECAQDRGIPFRATIAGNGPLVTIVEELAADYENVDYLGRVSEERKRELLNRGSVFVLPTYAEGLPIALLEGMAGGNAVVSTTVGAIPEVVGPENGVLVEPGDERRVAEALGNLLASPDRIKHMARRNRRLVETEYSWSRATERLTRIYNEGLETTQP